MHLIYEDILRVAETGESIIQPPPDRPAPGGSDPAFHMVYVPPDDSNKVLSLQSTLQTIY